MTSQPSAAPNVSAATTPIMPTTAAASAARTGTARAPRPGSTAIRSPITACGDRSARVIAAMTRADTPAPRAGARRPEVRQAANAAAATTRTTNAAKPAPSTTQSNARPGSGSMRRANPVGKSGDAHAAATTASATPSERRRRRGREQRHEALDARQAERAEKSLVVGTAVDMARERLSDGDDPGDRGDYREDRERYREDAVRVFDLHRRLLRRTDDRTFGLGDDTRDLLFELVERAATAGQLDRRGCRRSARPRLGTARRTRA